MVSWSGLDSGTSSTVPPCSLSRYPLSANHARAAMSCVFPICGVAITLPLKSFSTAMPESCRTTRPAPPLALPATTANFAPFDLMYPLIVGLGPTKVASTASIKRDSIADGPALKGTHSMGMPMAFSNSPVARA